MDYIDVFFLLVILTSIAGIIAVIVGTIFGLQIFDNWVYREYDYKFMNFFYLIKTFPYLVFLLFFLFNKGSDSVDYVLPNTLRNIGLDNHISLIILLVISILVIIYFNVKSTNIWVGLTGTLFQLLFSFSIFYCLCFWTIRSFIGYYIKNGPNSKYIDLKKT